MTEPHDRLREAEIARGILQEIRDRLRYPEDEQ